MSMTVYMDAYAPRPLSTGKKAGQGCICYPRGIPISEYEVLDIFQIDGLVQGRRNHSA